MHLIRAAFYNGRPHNFSTSLKQASTSRDLESECANTSCCSADVIQLYESQYVDQLI